VTKGVTRSGAAFFSEAKVGIKTGTPDQGTFSRYFNLDAWWEALPESVSKTFPFLIIPKASKAEKNLGCGALEKKRGQYRPNDNPDENSLRTRLHGSIAGKNSHPTVKPVKLMSYLIAIGSRPGDLILDPFMGSGTTLVAAKGMGRRAVGVDNDPECIPVAEARVKAVNTGLF
jgi:site-specific DNA-methyltransferase (adenine-specific)